MDFFLIFLLSSKLSHSFQSTIKQIDLVADLSIALNYSHYIIRHFKFLKYETTLVYLNLVPLMFYFKKIYVVLGISFI